jgi:hypothetical protein
MPARFSGGIASKMRSIISSRTLLDSWKGIFWMPLELMVLVLVRSIAAVDQTLLESSTSSCLVPF